MKRSRREFLKLAALYGAGLLLPGVAARTVQSATPTPGSFMGKSTPDPRRTPNIRIQVYTPPTLLDPTIIPQFTQPLLVPPAMPKHPNPPATLLPGADYYEISVRQIQQQILPPGLPNNFPASNVWGYGYDFNGLGVTPPMGVNFHNAPSLTIEATHDKPVVVKWKNELVSGGNFLPHLLPVDPTLHWANPGRMGVNGAIDTRPSFAGLPTPTAYTGPVPMVVHVHGAHTTEESDGYAEAWYLPASGYDPNVYTPVGSKYNEFKAKGELITGVPWTPGSAVFRYPNNQRAGAIWYHDHTLGMTRLNVHAGPAGFYMIRGGPDDLGAGILPSGDHELPLAIQDRSFTPTGQVFYPSERGFFDGYEIPYVPSSDISPIWNPEFFGNTIIVNGKVWPVHNVEPRRYRLRILNGCDARTLILKMVTAASDATVDNTAGAAIPFWVIGTEGGFLPQVTLQTSLLMMPAERFDVILDLTNEAGNTFYLVNEGPDDPFGGPGFTPANTATTGRVMKFVVGAGPVTDTTTPPLQITLPTITNLPAPTRTRKLTLMEMESERIPGFGPMEARLGIVDAQNNPVSKLWADAVTEEPIEGETETWELYNMTVDAHPMHIHQTLFQVINRQPFNSDTMTPNGVVRGPEVWETGFKDTVVAYPGEVTRLKVRFDYPGLFVWHCHIVEHEDNEMMRPLRVLYRHNLPVIING